MQVLTCPLCRGDVVPGSSGCRSCSLPMQDVARNQRRSGGVALLRGAGVRLTGLVLYVAAVAWVWFQLPDALVFVVPAAVGGGLLHVWRGRPWLGLVIFTFMVVALPLLLWPALGTGFWTNVRLGFR